MNAAFWVVDYIPHNFIWNNIFGMIRLLRFKKICICHIHIIMNECMNIQRKAMIGFKYIAWQWIEYNSIEYHKQIGLQSIRFLKRILKFFILVWMKQQDDVILYTILGFIYKKWSANQRRIFENVYHVSFWYII